MALHHRFCLILLLLTGAAHGAANDPVIMQRNATDTQPVNRVLTYPTSIGPLVFDPVTLLPLFVKFGTGLIVSGGFLNGFSGAYTDLTAIPSTFTPSAHTQAFNTITSTPTTLAGYGITDAYPLASNPAGYLTGITSSQVTTALGFTPYNAANPAGYITSSALSGYLTSATAASTYATAASLSGYLTTANAASTYYPLTNPSAYIAQAGARSAISLTTTGSGAATYNSTTGVLNVPTPAAGGTVTSVGVSSSNLTVTGSPVTTSGNIAVSLPSVITAGNYSGNLTVDAQGRVTAATATPFNFSQPASKTVVASTSYQAADPTKAAIIYPSYACQNATTVLAASGCTVQVRMGTGALTCSTGTVYYTQSLTVQLGVLITQNSTNPVPIMLPIGASFIVCATAGTFTVTAVEQAAG